MSATYLVLDGLTQAEIGRYASYDEAVEAAAREERGEVIEVQAVSPPPPASSDLRGQWRAVAAGLWLAADAARAARAWSQMRAIVEQAEIAERYGSLDGALLGAIFEIGLPEIGQDLRPALEAGQRPGAADAAMAARARVRAEMAAHAKRIDEARRADRDRVTRELRDQAAKARAAADAARAALPDTVEAEVTGHYKSGDTWWSARIGDTLVLVLDPDNLLGAPERGRHSRAVLKIERRPCRSGRRSYNASATVVSLADNR